MVDNGTPRQGGAEAGRLKLFSFCEELAEPVKQVLATAWASRGKVLRDVASFSALLVTLVCSMPGRAARVVKNPRLHALVAEEEDPEALAAVVCGVGGALCLGSVGAAVGIMVGGVCGTAVGAIPALFTFGLSLPVGAVVGGAGGLCLGTAVGGSSGFIGGATSGSGLAFFRGEIRHCIVYVGSKIYDVYDLTVVRPVNAVKATTNRACEAVHDSADYTVDKAKAVGRAVAGVAADRCVQVTAASAGVGAAAMGTAGAATGALAGGAAGAAAGLIPALFTFGLSIPIGAAVGGGMGLFAGGIAGTTAGFASGGATGYLGYRYRSIPGTALEFTKAKAHAAAAAAGFGGPAETNEKKEA